MVIDLRRSSPVSIRMVAEHAGVCAATVSNVLRGKPNVSQGFAARVRAAVDELGYVADSHASRLRSGKHSLAGVVVPDLSNPMFGTFVSTLERLARDDGFDLLVVSSANDPEQEAERLHSIRSWRPAGLIIIPCDGGLAERLPKGDRPPIVVADRIPEHGGFDLVAVDNARSAAAIAAHLVGQGYRSCLVAGSTLAISNVRERWEGAVGAAGGMAITMVESGLDCARIRERLRPHLAEGTRPDALFTLDHVTTLVAYRLLAELGLSIPRDIAFAGFDESEWMRLVTPPVTAVRQPVEEMAEAAWKQFVRRLSGGEAMPRTLRLPCTIEIRGSTLRPPGLPENAVA